MGEFILSFVCKPLLTAMAGLPWSDGHGKRRIRTAVSGRSSTGKTSRIQVRGIGMRSREIEEKGNRGSWIFGVAMLHIRLGARCLV